MSARPIKLSDHCQRLLNNEQALFEKEYQQHFLEGETKTKNIGEPYLLHNPESTHGVLLIHGLMAAPEEVREWADFLFTIGYSVYAPRMAGHGTSADDLNQRKMQEWIDSVDRGHEILKACCQHITIAGFSTGGAVALHQVIKKPEAFDALISISAPLKFKKFSSHFAESVNNWNRTLRFINNTSFNKVINTKPLRKEFVTNHADNPHINYLRCPVSSIVQIKLMMKGVYNGLSSIRIPTLIIHANGDPKVDVQSGRDIFKRIKSEKKQYKEIDFHMHGIVRGDISKEVFKEIATFLL
jgi:esterase/lipase